MSTLGSGDIGVRRLALASSQPVHFGRLTFVDIRNFGMQVQF
jgi:hypothetical protein